MTLKRRRRFGFLVVGIIIVFAGCTSSNKLPATQALSSPSPIPTTGIAIVDIVRDPLDVPYVPTPHSVVARMLEMANVTKTILFTISAAATDASSSPPLRSTGPAASVSTSTRSVLRKLATTRSRPASQIACVSYNRIYSRQTSARLRLLHCICCRK